MKTVLNNITYIILCSLIVVACGDKSSNSEEKSETSDKTNNSKVTSVEVVNPQQRSFTGELLLTGMAKPNKMVMLYAMESGYVKSIRKDIGDYVKNGESIATLENPDVQREFDVKKAQFDSKKTTYDRLKASFDRTPALTPLQVLEDANAAYLSAKADLEGVQNRLNFLSLRAPFSGTITKRFVDNGAMVQSGLNQSDPQALVEIQEISTIRLTLTLAVPESDIANVKKGTEVNITFPELSGESYVRKVSRTAGALDLASKTMQVEIDIKNTDGKIRPGMYAKALINAGSRDKVNSLPVTAQIVQQNQAFVFIVNADNKVERIELRKGLSNKDYFEVLNAELSTDTKVIVEGKNLVKEGTKVNPIFKEN